MLEEKEPQPPKMREMPKELFDELDAGLRQMFRTSVEREQNGPEARMAGVAAAEALMKLHGKHIPK